MSAPKPARPDANPTPEPNPAAAALTPYEAEGWGRLTPRERLRLSWALRARLPDLQAVHDRKPFPKP
jgi:hypothetical protein